MNDLRRLLIWLSTIACLMVAIWVFQWHEESLGRPFVPQFREFRLANRVNLFGYVFYIPWRRMLCGWGAILLAAAALWPLATGERSRATFGRWERRGPGGARDRP